MKTSIWVFVFAFVPLMAVGQQNFPLVKDGGIWREGYVVKVEPPDPWLKFRIQWVMEGDTVINNQTYKKLYQSNYGPSVLTKTFFGGMREDSIGRVYVYPDTNQSPPGTHLQSHTEYLLYDFTLQVGDTLMVSNSFNIIQILSSIDSVLIDNHYRKLYTFNAPGDHREVIEGIGSVKGLFFPMVYGFEHGQMLTCYEDGDIFWNNPALMGTDCFSVWIQERRQEPDFVTVYPVPFSDQLHIDVGDVRNDDVTIHLFDITGRLMREHHLSGQKEVTLDVANLAQGAYILKAISNGHATKTIKVIKQ